MKFQLIVWVCLIFYTYDSANFKSIGNNTMEKNYSRYCAGPAYYRMCSTDVYCSNKPAAVAPKAITHIISSFLEIGQKKTVDAAKICGGAENVVKTETQQTFVNGLLGFITLGIYTPLEARVYCRNCIGCPSI